ncbi:MAG: CDP-2,3-bis-(O-geranylgeranyl)-sn-glycerol synthase [Candidatus Bathyarchaeia archaeon]|nr:CDP-2,3-bis-(O-geranylgeranyl)-sn-glycerol synthase [Candidatus Bathyarchaeota archaeon]
MLLNPIELLVFILPVYVANASPVILGGGAPLDLGRKFMDGKPIFGPHKTFKGFIGGLIAGWMTATILSALLGWGWLKPGLLACAGSMMGDLIGAFIKRRIGLKAGESAPLLDQLDFIIGALILVYPIWKLSMATVLISLSITPPIHLATNWIAYKLNLKKVPW